MPYYQSDQAYQTQHVRRLQESDIPAIERLLRTSEYIYQRFTTSELSLYLQRYPAMGFFHDTSLHGFLLSQVVNPTCAWIAGFGVSWTESKSYITILMYLIDHLISTLQEQGVTHLHYSGNNIENDWLRSLLISHGFIPYGRLYAYDKLDYQVPAVGNQEVIIRPVNLSTTSINNDMAALLTIEEACFEDLWRYDATTFRDIALTHPYFVVAELHGQVIGYQFNALDGEYGYLVRIAVHPSANRMGIGIRLMSEAISFFQKARVTRIMLNTQEDNYHAHRLYEWFSFIRLKSMGFVLRKALTK